MTKRLYVVTVSYEYAVLASSEREAESFTHLHDAESDTGTDYKIERSRLAATVDCRPPRDWDGDCLIYGAPRDMKWSEAVEQDKAVVTADPAPSE
jgi:hypothetical protein